MDWRKAIFFAFLLTGGAAIQPAYADLLPTRLTDDGSGVPDLLLADQEGAEATLAGLLKKKPLSVLAPVYTSCPDVCPALAGRLRDSYAGLPQAMRDKLGVVFLSFQTEDETEDLAGFHTRNNLPAEWKVTVGGQEQTRALLDQLSYLFTATDEENFLHPGQFFLLDRSGQLLATAWTGGLEEGELQDHLQAATSLSGRLRVAIGNPNILALVGLGGFVACLVTIAVVVVRARAA